MSKLYFRYGAMGASKSLNLLAVVGNYVSQKDLYALTMLPKMPGVDYSKMEYFDLQVKSRFEGYLGGTCGRVADGIIDEKGDFFDIHGSTVSRSIMSCILVDEAQFLTEEAVSTLYRIAHAEGIPVICYGLRTDFRGLLFPGSKRLLELADSIEEIKTLCEECHRLKATFNIRVDEEGDPVREGPQVALKEDTSVTYRSICGNCFVGWGLEKVCTNGKTE